MQYVFLRFSDGFYLKFFLVVEETLAGCKEDVVHVRVYSLRERAVALDAQLQVGAVAAHHVYLRFGQFVAVHLVDPAFHGLYYLRFLEAVDVVPAACVAPVGREEATVVQPFKRHAEVVALRVERIPRVFEYETSGLRVNFCDVNVESAQSLMAVGREIQVAIGPERGEHFVARRIDRFAQVLDSSKSG